jgi:hypothetical protein
MVRFLWRATRGYRLRPWRSPFLRWRIETWSGMPAASIGFLEFWEFVWGHRGDLVRFLRWAARQEAALRR